MIALRFVVHCCKREAMDGISLVSPTLNILTSRNYCKMIIHIPTKITFQNRKEAKMVMGRGRYERLAKKGEFQFVNTPEKDKETK